MKMGKNMTNLEIAELLRAVAAAYQLKDSAKNKFKIIAYERAADAVEHASSELKDIWDDGKLEKVPGIGPSIAGHLGEMFRTGTSAHFEKVMAGLPPQMFTLMEVPGIGAKTAYRLVEELKIKSLDGLLEAAKKGKIAVLPGFGEQSQAEIIKEIEMAKGKSRRHLLPYAESVAREVIAWMKGDKNLSRIDPLGSLRRKAATIGDIDIAVATADSDATLTHFGKYPNAKQIIERGEATSSVFLPGDIQVDLMVQPLDAYGALLVHFTGSKHHNIALRDFALKKGLSISEYGIKNLKTGKLAKFTSEEDFYRYLGLEWIPPEMREDTGEIKAAHEHKLPKLVELGDVKADLQIHSSFDIETSHDLGQSTMEEIIAEAGRLGYSYLAFTEHNPSRSKHTLEEIVDLLRRKAEAIEKLNYSLVKGMKKGVKKVFNSLEIDIRPDGALPVPEAGMNTLDFALVSVHGSFRLPRAEMTKRVLQALSHPKAKIFAHPTARKLTGREGIELNWPEVFEFCLKNNKWIEVNADPMRLDLPDMLVREAVKAGVKLTLGTDSHHKDAMANMQFGVDVARRGWAEAKNIVNCLSLEEFERAVRI